MRNRITNISQCFNKAADTYDDACHVQWLAGQKLLGLLKSQIFDSTHIIDLGCGTGVVTEQLAIQLPFKQFYGIDIAEQLLQKAKNRLQPYNVKIKNQDFQSFNYNQLFNLIFSNMALQWSLDFNFTIQHITSQLATNGLFAISIPLMNTFHELPHLAKNSFYTATEIQNIITHANLSILSFVEDSITYEFDTSLSALKSIKAVGANYIMDSTSNHLRGKSILKNYPNKLTYHLGFIVARKKHEF